MLAETHVRAGYEKRGETCGGGMRVSPLGKGNGFQNMPEHCCAALT